MGEIPAWAMDAAWETWKHIRFPAKLDDGEHVQHIARALVAERERARSIAKGAWLTCDFGSIADADTMNDLSMHIADLIDPDSTIRKGK